MARRPGAEARVSLSKRRTWYADPPAAPPAKDGEGDDAPPEPEKPKLPEGAPEWIGDPIRAYDEIKKLRTENARKRVEAKPDAKPKAEEPPTPDDRIAALEAKAAAAERRALIAEIATEFGLPKDLAARLQGDDEEALRADAELLKAYIPAPKDGEGEGKPPKPGGRQTQTTTVPSGTPAKETDAQRRARLYNGGANAFQGGGVVYNGSLADLDNPVG